MSAPHLLIDNDILILLSRSGLLDDAVNALGFDLPSAFRLAPLPYMLDRTPGLRALPLGEKQLIRENCNRLAVIVEQPNAKLLTLLSHVRKIDNGEAILYSVAAEHSAYLITTGDKVAMRALTTEASLRAICQSLAGRVICLEALCLELVKAYGVYRIASAFAPIMSEYASLKTYFGAVEVSGEAGCFDALYYHLDHLNRQVGDGFLWSP